MLEEQERQIDSHPIKMNALEPYSAISVQSLRMMEYFTDIPLT